MPLVAQTKSPGKVISYWRLPGYLNKAEVESVGGRVIEMPEYNSFYVLWIPKSQSSPEIVVDLAERLPYDSFKQLYPKVSQSGAVLVSLLCWQGGESYLPAAKLYGAIEGILKRLKGEFRLDIRRSILHPSGSLVAQREALLALDDQSKNRFFKLMREGKLEVIP